MFYNVLMKRKHAKMIMVSMQNEKKISKNAKMIMVSTIKRFPIIISKDLLLVIMCFMKRK